MSTDEHNWDFTLKDHDIFAPLAIIEWIKQTLIWNLGDGEIVPYDKIAGAAERLSAILRHQHMIERKIPD